MKWGNHLPKFSNNHLSMKCANSKNYRYVCGVSVLCIGLILLISGCNSKEIDSQLVQPANESWKEKQKVTTDNIGPSDITIRINTKLKENVAFMKPSKFDEHVDEEQYVDNPLLLMGMTAKKTTTSLQPVNVTIASILQPFSANQSTKLNHTHACNESTINVTRYSVHSANITDHVQLIDVDTTNDSSHSALLRKRNSATLHSVESLNLNSSNNTTPIYYKSSSELKNAPSVLLISSRNDTKPAYAQTYTQVAYAAPHTPKYYHKSYLNQGNMYNYKLKKETEDYRMQEKRTRRQNRVRRSLYQLPFNDVIYHRPLRRRYYSYLPEDRIDYWDQYADQHRRFVRFPLQTDAYRAANRPLNAVPPPPPPAPPLSWSPPQLPQYAAYHQNLPPVPSMGPRSPRLVFRDPVEPGTVQAPFSPNGLQDIAAPEDNRDDWPDVDDGNENRLCPTGSCEFFLTCWMSSGLIEGACGGGLLYACCLRNNGKATDRGASSISSNDIQLPSNYGPVINDPRCGVSVAKQQTAQRRIVGGDEAGFGNFPWQAYIRIGSSRCGGTLVNRYHVVTAGHCVARATARQVQVTLGDYVINSAVEPLPAYTFGVRKINVHPYFKFTPQADRFDVAVLRLDRPVQYMPHISPICLPDKDEDFLDKYAWAAGWGALQAGSRLRPKTLQAVDVPIIDNRQCERWHKSNGINVVIYDEMMCAGYRGGLKDSCQGDSGGPLMLEKTGRWYLIGIVSAGYSCAQRGQPGIYHRVAHTVDWISYIINS